MNALFPPPDQPSTADDLDSVFTSDLNPKPIILIAEDEAPLRELLSKSLLNAGYEVITCCNGREALDMAKVYNIDLALLDVLMPEVSGHAVCVELRKSSDVPIIMLTALSNVDELESALYAGADDYIAKPFSFSNLEARVFALLRRVHWIKFGMRPKVLDLELHRDNRVTIRGQSVQLSPIEYKLLYYLVQCAEETVSREYLLDKVWGYRPIGKARILHTNIRRLRQKIEVDPANPKHIITVMGIGYLFTSNSITNA